MIFSIITVCYNAQQSIAATMDSIFKQRNIDFEYIIKDGGSTDNTIDIIKEYQSKYALKLITEQDSGVYAAMNEAVSYASGEYIIFLNSGDVFYDEKVLSEVKELIEAEKPEILYGNAALYSYEKNDREEIIPYAREKRLDILKIAYGKTVCHQVIFAKRKLLKERGFDESFQYWADQEWLAFYLSKGVKTIPFDRTIVKYDISGMSSKSQNLDKIRKENDRITKKYAPILAYFLLPLKKIYRYLSKTL